MYDDTNHHSYDKPLWALLNKHYTILLWGQVVLTNCVVHRLKRMHACATPSYYLISFIYISYIVGRMLCSNS